MTSLAFCRPDDYRPPADAALLARIDRRLEGSGGALAAVPPGCLVSLSVPLPPAESGQWEATGDIRWRVAAEGMAVTADGTAAAVAVRGPDALAGLAGAAAVLTTRVRLDGEGPAPRAFFHAEPGLAELRLPIVQAVEREGAAWLILAARRDRRPPSVQIGAWREAVQHFLGAPSAPVAGAPRRLRRLSERPGAGAWQARVRAATAAIASGAFDKVVLGRRVTVELSHPLDCAAAVRRMAALYPACNVFALPYGNGTLLAASPERVAACRGRRIVADALAGTAACPADPLADQKAAAHLLASAKERREHCLVVAAVAAALRTCCQEVEVPPEPSVMALRRLRHLWTPVSGRLAEGAGLFEALAALHPTPAIAGFPRDAALAWAAAIGETRDKLYGGLAGWIDAATGDGEAALVLRSAWLQGRVGVLWAGAGIVQGSTPPAEMAETEAKLAVLTEILETA